MIRKMNLGLQKHTILNIFKKFNPDADPQNLDWQNLDSTCDFSENLDNMKNAHPQYAWDDGIEELEYLEHLEHDRQMDMLHNASVEDDEVMERILSLYDIDDFSTNLLSKLAKQEQQQVGEIFSTVVRIKSTTRKGKGKKYSYGCIQDLFDSKYVGLKAKIIVFGTKYSECIDEDLENYYNI